MKSVTAPLAKDASTAPPPDAAAKVPDAVDRAGDNTQPSPEPKLPKFSGTHDHSKHPQGGAQATSSVSGSRSTDNDFNECFEFALNVGRFLAELNRNFHEHRIHQPPNNGSTTATAAPPDATLEFVREKVTKKAITADHPTWCPGCGDFAVLASYYKVIEKRQLDHEKIVTLAGIGCSSRFPYFVNGYGAHFIHGRAVPLACGISLARPDLHVFLFGGDGDGFSIGGNHLNHGARKNINMTYFIMDNFVYGLTKKQTSPTSPIGFKARPTRPARSTSRSTR